MNLTEWSDILIVWLVAHGVKIVVIPIAALIIKNLGTRFIERAVRVTIVKDKHMSGESERQREDTLIRIFNGAFEVILFLVAGLMILEELGVAIGPILAGAGIVGLAFGFGGQYLIRDLITGLFLIIENQYRIGDVVSFDKTSGLVEDITLRMTTLRDLDGTVHFVPHGSITRVSNLSKDYARVNLDVGISYNSKLEHVIQVINQTGKQLSEDPKWKDFIIKPPQFLRVNNFADSAIELKILGDTVPLQQWNVTGELRKRLKFAFDKEGIEIPFPQRVIYHKNEVDTVE